MEINRLNKLWRVITVLISAVLISASAVNADSRDEIINSTLDCVASQLSQQDDITWGDICYSDFSENKSAPADSEVFEDSAYWSSEDEIDTFLLSDSSNYDERPYQYNIFQESATDSHSDKSNIRTNTSFYNYFEENVSDVHFEISTEFSSIEYEEPGLMKQEGEMFGVNAALMYRTQKHDFYESWGDVFNDDNKINMVRLEGKLSWGEVDYTSNGTGSLDDEEDFMFEPRLLIGYDFPTRWMLINLYSGFGYRYLKNESSGRRTTTGAYGYDREANYYYIPIGFDFHQDLWQNFELKWNIEYDWFIKGKQISHLEDVPAPVGYNSFEELSNDQDSGYGLKGSVRLTRKNSFADLFIEPFVRYWNIESSDPSPIILDGQVISPSPGYLLVGYEPDNHSTEYGLKLGAHF